MWDWGYSSMVECTLSICADSGSISSTKNTKDKEIQKYALEAISSKFEITNIKLGMKITGQRKRSETIMKTLQLITDVTFIQ